VSETGVHITDGSWAFAGSPGHRFITEGFASVVEEAGGDILTKAPVKEIMIRNGRAIGVAAEIEGKKTEIEAPVVVCTLPPKALLKVIPESILPPEFIRLTKNIIHTAMVAGQFGPPVH